LQEFSHLIPGMKRKATLALALALITSMVFDARNSHVNGNSSGAPAGNTGSPADGQSCARIGCHSGPAQTNQVASITGDIPAGGYVPGTTYNMTATMSNNSGPRFGFSISPHDQSGFLIGTLIASGAGTQLNGNGKYITHTFQGTSGSGGSKSWTFQWTAPEAGLGSVTFYGAFNFANGVGSSGDVIVPHSQTFTEAAATGIAEAGSAPLSVFPTPAEDHINIRMGDVDEVISVNMVGMDGRMVLSEEMTSPARIDLVQRNVRPGIYILSITRDGGTGHRRVVVR
jgi:hypothetical protein